MAIPASLIGISKSGRQEYSYTLDILVMNTRIITTDLKRLGAGSWHRLLMRYNVSQLLKDPIGATRSYQLDEDLNGPEWYADKASGPVRVLRTHQGALVNATLAIQSTLRCGRCLGEFAETAELLIEEEFFPTVDLHTGRGAATPKDVEESVLIDSDHTLDLAATLRQYIVAALPMKPLCSADCNGLCQECGVNKNLETCACSERQGDPRWRGLQGLAKELKG